MQFSKEPVSSKGDMGYDFQVLLKCSSSVTNGPGKATRIHNTLEEDLKVGSYLIALQGLQFGAIQTPFFQPAFLEGVSLHVGIRPCVSKKD